MVARIARAASTGEMATASGKARRAPGRNVSDANRFLSRNLRVDARRGVVELAGHRVMLLRVEFLVSIQKQLEMTLGASAKGLLYLAGERAGTEVLPAFSDDLKDLHPRGESRDVLRRMSAAWATSGVGRTTVTEFDPREGRFAFRIDHGSFPEAYGPSPKPVCHLWAGWTAGVARTLFGRGVLCEEVRCRAAGGDACEFVIGPMPRA